MSEKRELIYVDDERGRTVGIDPVTREVVEVAKDCKQPKKRRKNLAKRRQIRMVNGQPAAFVSHERIKFPPTHSAKALFLERYSTGLNFEQASSGEGLPGPKVIRHWLIHDQKKHHHKAEEFRAAYQESRKLGDQIRAEAAHDKVISLAEDTDEGNAQSRRVQIDAHKWSAKVHDPARYGDKTKISGDANAPLQIIVETGIRRDPVDVQSVPEKKGELE